MIVYVFAILGCIYASIEGVREAYYYHVAVSQGFKKNIHWLYLFQRTLFTILLFSQTNFFILAFFILSFSFLHNGFYYLARNKLDKLAYPKKFIDNSTTSTAIMEFNFIERIIMLGFAIVFLILNIIYR